MNLPSLRESRILVQASFDPSGLSSRDLNWLKTRFSPIIPADDFLPKKKDSKNP